MQKDLFHTIQQNNIKQYKAYWTTIKQLKKMKIKLLTKQTSKEGNKNVT